MRPDIERSGGFSLVEMMLALAVITIGVFALVQQVTLGFRTVATERSRSEAFQKASQILAEIQSRIAKGQIADTQALDLEADGLSANPVMTALRLVDGSTPDPDHPTSGNYRTEKGHWAWGRQVTVQQHESHPTLRYVTVHVGQTSSRTGRFRPSAHAAALLSVTATHLPPKQVVDVYLIAIGSVLSDLGPMDEVRAQVARQVQDLESVDQGVQFRLHWITRMGYGRDPLYTPWCDPESTSDAPSPFVLRYPGRDHLGRRLHSPELLGGRVNTPCGVLGDYDPETHSLPIAIADRWNYCLQGAEALDLHQLRVEQGLEEATEPPLDVLLGQLHDQPERYRNAVFLNLHGSTTPLPPLRPVPDPARLPTEHPGVQVVTHAATLFTPRMPTSPPGGGFLQARDAEFRVHAYQDDPDSGPFILREPITLRIPGADLSQDINHATNPSLLIRCLPGGIDPNTGDPNGSCLEYHGFDDSQGLPPKDAPTTASGMYFRAGFATTPSPHTWVQLYNTPLVAPPVAGKGLPLEQRLYGVDHIASPVAGDVGFPQDLATTGTGPKNTARWRIRIPRGVMTSGLWTEEDRRVTALTSIGTSTTPGVLWPVPHEPYNVSAAHTWWGCDPQMVPVLARTHLVGDPRTVPHADLLAGGTFAHSYNCYFGDLRAGAVDASSDWPGLDAERMADGFGAGFPADVPRFGTLWRTGLMRAGALWLNVGGATAQRFLLGGELARVEHAWDGSSHSIQTTGMSPGGTQQTAVNTLGTPGVTGTSDGPQVLKDSFSGHTVLPWVHPIGTGIPGWETSGNVASASSSHAYTMSSCGSIDPAWLPRGAEVTSRSGGFVGVLGPAALLNNGTAGTTMLHGPHGGTTEANATTSVEEILLALGENLPAEIESVSPFQLHGPLPCPLPWRDWPDEHPMAASTMLEEWWQHPLGSTAAGLIALTPAADAGDPEAIHGFLAPISLSPGTSSISPGTPTPSPPSVGGIQSTDPDQLAPGELLIRNALLLGVRSLHRLGLPGTAGRMPHDPMVRIVSPRPEELLAQPTSIQLEWETEWVRFDGEPFTQEHPAAFQETESGYGYAVKVSTDDGGTWFHGLDGTPTELGRRPAAEHLAIHDAIPGNESITLPTPTELWPAGQIRIRVEAFHRGRPNHHAFHEIHLQLTR